jgi:hypothetical protein
MEASGWRGGADSLERLLARMSVVSGRGRVGRVGSGGRVMYFGFGRLVTGKCRVVHFDFLTCITMSSTAGEIIYKGGSSWPQALM